MFAFGASPQPLEHGDDDLMSTLRTNDALRLEQGDLPADSLAPQSQTRGDVGTRQRQLELNGGRAEISSTTLLSTSPGEQE